MEAARIGVKRDPPTLVLDYIIIATGSKRRRKMPIRHIQLNSTATQLTDRLRARHRKYLELVDHKMVVEMIDALLDANPLRRLAVAADLNKVSEEDLLKHKSDMDVVFRQNAKDRFDADFEYKVVKDFKAKEKSAWDDDDDDDDDLDMDDRGDDHAGSDKDDAQW